MPSSSDFLDQASFFHVEMPIVDGIFLRERLNSMHANTQHNPTPSTTPTQSICSTAPWLRRSPPRRTPTAPSSCSQSPE